MLPAEAAKLLQFKLAARRLLVLGGVVVPPLAVGALENDVVAHEFLETLASLLTVDR